jgi:phosphate transport system substrate-binding protein
MTRFSRRLLLKGSRPYSRRERKEDFTERIQMEERNMKRKIIAVLIAAALLPSAVGCAAGGEGGAGGTINVITREDGSGTRGAFIELFGVQDEEGVDRTAESAEITNNTAVMMTSVAGNRDAVGYISLGSLNDTVKALKIDGVQASADNINNGSYTVFRPFLIATQGAAGGAAADFIAFILSRDGQDIVADRGYIRIDDTGAYAGGSVSGKVIVAGSSSVTPLMEVLQEAYMAIHPDVDIEIQQSDSSTGMNAAIDCVCDIGMASRALKDSEIEKGLTATVIATDGIAVIVSNENPVDGLTKDQVREIFTGGLTGWAEIE